MFFCALVVVFIFNMHEKKKKQTKIPDVHQPNEGKASQEEDPEGQ